MDESNWTVPTSIDAGALTPASWVTLTQVGFRLALGFTERQVAKELGWPQKMVKARLDTLRAELAKDLPSGTPSHQHERP